MRGVVIAAVVAVLVLAGTASAQQTVTITTFGQLREYAFRTATRLLGVEQRVATLEQRVAALEARDRAWSEFVALQACIWNGTLKANPTITQTIAGLTYWSIPAGYTCPPVAPAPAPALPLRPK